MSSYTTPAKVTVTTDTLTEVVAAQGARSFVNVYAILMSNEDSTATFVDIYEGASVILPKMAVPAGLGNNIKLDKPIRLAENTSLSIKASVAVTSLNVGVVYDVEPSGNG
jgi:hypothetical protein